MHSALINFYTSEVMAYLHFSSHTWGRMAIWLGRCDWFLYKSTAHSSAAQILCFRLKVGCYATFNHVACLTLIPAIRDSKVPLDFLGGSIPLATTAKRTDSFTKNGCHPWKILQADSTACFKKNFYNNFLRSRHKILHRRHVFAAPPGG